MKVIKAKYEFIDRYAERYELNELYHPWSDRKSLTACYLLCNCPELTVQSLSVKARFEERGTPLAWSATFDGEDFAEQFSSAESFRKRFDLPDFGSWYLTGVYQGVTVSFGGSEGAQINCTYTKEKDIKLLPLLLQVETASYEHADYDKALVMAVVDIFKLTTKRAVQSLDKLARHPDIYREFVSCGLKGLQPFPGSEIRVEGFSAWELHKQYPLSLLGAYNYLIYLREAPAQALADLKKGLPRR